MVRGGNRHISRRIHFVRNGKECNMHKTVWCEGGMQLSYIVTKSVREDYLNCRLGYALVRLENSQNTSTRIVIRYRIILKNRTNITVT